MHGSQVSSFLFPDLHPDDPDYDPATSGSMAQNLTVPTCFNQQIRVLRARIGGFFFPLFQFWWHYFLSETFMMSLRFPQLKSHPYFNIPGFRPPRTRVSPLPVPYDADASHPLLEKLETASSSGGCKMQHWWFQRVGNRPHLWLIFQAITSIYRLL